MTREEKYEIVRAVHSVIDEMLLLFSNNKTYTRDAEARMHGTMARLCEALEIEYLGQKEKESAR